MVIQIFIEEEAKKYDNIVILFDELNSAAQSAGGTIPVLLNKRVGQYVPKRKEVPGNRESDKGVTYRMPILANRFYILK